MDDRGLALNQIPDSGTPPPVPIAAPTDDQLAAAQGLGAVPPALPAGVQPPPVHHSILSDVLHAVGDVLGGPRTRQMVDAQGNIVESPPLDRRQRIGSGISTLLIGAGAGLAQHGPGHLGKAVLAGAQAEQAAQQQRSSQIEQQSQNVRQGIMNRATLEYQNQQMLRWRREDTRMDAETNSKISEANLEYESKLEAMHATKPPIMVNGKDVNGQFDNEADMMKYFTSNGIQAPKGFHYVYVPSTDAQGRSKENVYQIPDDVYSQPVQLSRAEYKRATGVEYGGSGKPDDMISVSFGGLTAAKNAYTDSLQKQSEIDLRKAQEKEVPSTIARNNAEAKKFSAEAQVALANVGVGDFTKTGEEYISSLPPADQNTVRAIGGGRMEITPGMLRSKEGQRLAKVVNQAYPGFDMSRAAAYFKTRQGFTSGKEAAGINHLNTAIAHLGKLYDATTSSATLPIVSGIARSFGGDHAKQFEYEKKKVGEEIEAAYASSALTDADKKTADKEFREWNPSNVRKGEKALTELLLGKLQAYQTQWTSAKPSPAIPDFPVISPANHGVIQKITGQNIPTISPSQSRQSLPGTETPEVNSTDPAAAYGGVTRSH